MWSHIPVAARLYHVIPAMIMIACIVNDSLMIIFPVLTSLNMQYMLIWFILIAIIIGIHNNRNWVNDRQ
jgi:hypothetical protein